MLGILEPEVQQRLNMCSIESLIEGSEKVTSVLGGWSSFHDAEIVELHLSRGDVDPERKSYRSEEHTS